METRTILQIVLGSVVVLCVGFGGFLIYTLTKKPETIVITEVVEDDKVVKEAVNPWSEKGDLAVTLVKRLQARLPETDGDSKPKKGQDDAEDVQPKLVEELLQDDAFVQNTLKLTGTRVGWDSTWWGETKYGPSFFMVRYVFKDGDIQVGPQWLVDLKTQKVVAKNLYAAVAADPVEGKKSPYYDRKQQIVSTIASHRFENGMSLAGALLLYFEQRQDADSGDTIVGWTIDHESGNIFKAYFQWVANKEATYAEFEFDYDAKALKAVNLQAANIMRIGEEFKKTRVSIQPVTFDSKKGVWTGPSKKQCRSPKNRARCRALASVLTQNEVVESLEWLLTARAASAEDFKKCKEKRDCRWKPGQKDAKTFQIEYRYRLGDSEDKSVSWDINVATREVTPTNRLSKLAFSVIRPR